jgi:hypothetical protein
MNRRNSAAALAVLCLVAIVPATARPALTLPQLFKHTPRPPPPSLVFAYHGWRIDASRAARVQPPAKTVRAIEAQVDLVERLGLRPDVLAFMRAQPIVADGAKAALGDYAEYAPVQGVLLHARMLDAKKPILLSGLLKAYLIQRLPGGPANPQLTTLRSQAAARRVWPKTALMLQSNEAFFSLSAAAYLYGAITREPYSRTDLKKTEPGCYQWLAGLFDGGRPRA